jgi:pimeloyl-ACP methyl ester carboxylesterase
VVSLPGIHRFDDGPDPMDLYGAVRGLVGGTSAYAPAVAKALDLACVPRGAEVMLVGHSQGGITALDLAADPRFNGQRVRVTHVITAGSPVSGLHPAPGTGSRVLELDNDADLVPQLDLRDSRRGRADGRIAVVFRRDDGSIGDDHSLLATYVPFAASGAFATAPGVADWLASAAPYLRRVELDQQRFALRDR